MEEEDLAPPASLAGDPVVRSQQRPKTTQQRRSAGSPLQAKEPRPVTSHSFHGSQVTPCFVNPKEIYYRERHQMEETRRAKFDAENQHRYVLDQVHSPYRYRMLKHSRAVDKKFKQKMVEAEENVMKERYRATLRYRAAVNESWEHEAKLVKDDHFSIWYPALRILKI
jgi:hypothetical protein